MCLKLLYHTCGRYGLLPKALWVPLCYDRTRDERYRGGYADVWMGTYCGRDVAVKVIRTYQNDKLQAITKVCPGLGRIPALYPLTTL